jgi:acylphosphatase
MKVITKKYLVYGMVQMVGFRWFAKQKADQFNIKGYVRNTNRGEVEILAQGKEEDLQVFVDYLNQGPSRSRVEKLVQEIVSEEKLYQQFSIKM